VYQLYNLTKRVYIARVCLYVGILYILLYSLYRRINVLLCAFKEGDRSCMNRVPTYFTVPAYIHINITIYLPILSDQLKKYNMYVCVYNSCRKV